MIQFDTHVLLWRELEAHNLSPGARAAIEGAVRAGEPIAISPVTLWEIAQLTRRGRIQLSVPVEVFFRRIGDTYRVVPMNSDVAIAAADLPDPFLKDPMDRLITATAMVEKLTLITADRNILASGVCKLLW